MKNSELLEKFLKDGGDTLSDKEYLELLTSYSKSADAEKLFSNYGSFRAVADSDTEFLISSGIDIPTVVLLRIISELSALYQQDSDISGNLKTSVNAKKYFSKLFRGVNNEQFIIASVNKSGNVIALSRIAVGNSVRVSASCRLLADFVIKNKAERVFVSHNHPIGNAEASVSDILSTAKIISILKVMGTSLTDHIIVGKNGAVSMRELNVCSELNNEPCTGYKYSSVN